MGGPLAGLARKSKREGGTGLVWSGFDAGDMTWLTSTGRHRLFHRHPELVSGSMARRLLRRSAGRERRPWMLNQVQHDDIKRPLPTSKQKLGLSYIIRLCQLLSGSFIRWIKAMAVRLAGAATARRVGRVQHASKPRSGLQ